MKLLRLLKSLTSARERALKMRSVLEEQSKHDIKRGEIRITGTAFADTEVHIGGRKTDLERTERVK